MNIPTIDWQSVKLVILDLDGTLYNQKPIRNKMMLALLAHVILKPWDFKILKIISSFRKEREKVSNRNQVNLDQVQYDWCSEATGYKREEIIKIINEWMYEKPLSYLNKNKFPFVNEFIEELKNRGVKVAVYSDYPVMHKLEAMNIQVDYSICSTDADVDSFKPNSRGLHKIAEHFNIQTKDCLVIGDRFEHDGEAALRAGMAYIIKPEHLTNFYGDLLNSLTSKAVLYCRICDSTNMSMIKPSDAQVLTSENFAITNSHYGKTGELHICNSCKFIQTKDLNNVVNFYENLVDLEYENTRKERLIQEKKIISFIKKYKSSGRLLDIGAGSGILIEASLTEGYESIGIEPSRWLVEQANKKGLQVIAGLFPNDKIEGHFDVITLVDIIEHVENPLKLITDARNQLTDDGILVLITPDVSSIAAKLLKYKWWHFRFAHIGYFNRFNLNLLAHRAGLKPLKTIRPSWYFSLRYLMERVSNYLPSKLKLPMFKFYDKITIPVNLRDSILTIYKKK